MGARRKLELVPVEEPPGDAQMTAERAHEWSAGQKLCRRRKRHHWRAHTAYAHGDINQPGTLIDVTERCPDCRNQRQADHIVTALRWGGTGIRMVDDKWKMIYLDVNGVPYLLEKGSQPLSDDLRNEMYAAEFANRRITYVDDDPDTEIVKKTRRKK